MSSLLHTQAAAIVADNRPAESWPDEGKVEFINYSTRYREGLDLVIKGINFTVKPGEKVSAQCDHQEVQRAIRPQLSLWSKLIPSL